MKTYRPSIARKQPDNAGMRQAMQQFVADPTAKAAAELTVTLMLGRFKVLVPMVELPDGTRRFASVRIGHRHPILHVWTHMDLVPERDRDATLYAYSYVYLILDLLEGEETWSGVIVDPEEDHSIAHYFPPEGGHTIYSTARLRRAALISEKGWN